MPVRVVFLEIQRSIIHKEMKPGIIITEKRTSRHIKEIVVRTEPEFHRTCCHAINQVNSRWGNFTRLQGQRLAANAIYQFTFSENRFQFIEVKRKVIHC